MTDRTTDQSPASRAPGDPWHTCLDPSLPGPGDPECPGCMKEANPLVRGEYVAGGVRECGRWHPEGAVEHNAPNCWLATDGNANLAPPTPGPTPPPVPRGYEPYA